MKWSQYLNILNSVRAKTLQSKLDLFFKLMDSDENGKLSYSEIKFLCFHSLKKLLKSSEDFVEDLSGNFAKFVFNALGLNMSEEIKTKTLKNFMVNNSQSREVDLLLMMCCAEKNQDEKFLDDNIHMDNSVYTNKATENNLKAKGEFFKKEELLLKKQLKFDPDNKKLQKRSSVIQIAKILNFQQEKDIYNDEIIKKKQEEKNLMEKLKQKAEERKINLIKFGGNESDILE